MLSGANTIIKITEDRLKYLEDNIDILNENLPVLQSFILPKGDIHLARAIVRRAERRVWDAIELHDIDSELNSIDPMVAKYLNRLSDFLFVLSRYDYGRLGETLWKPMGENVR